MKMNVAMMLCWVVASAPGCGMDSDGAEKGSDSKDASAGIQCFGANDCPPGSMCNAFGTCSTFKSPDGGTDGSEAGLPPEVEQKRQPPASGKYNVFLIVPEQDMVVRIHATSLAVHSIKVGKKPVALRTVKGQDVAVVLNRGSSTAHVLRVDKDGGDSLVSLKTAKNLNELKISPDGKYALAFFDVSRSGGKLSPNQNFQDVTLISLQKGQESTVNYTVGFRPTSVQFSSSGNQAHIVTDQGVSVITLKPPPPPSILPTIPVTKDPLTEARPDEVLVTPDGKLALIRSKNLKGVRVVDLATQSLTDVALDGEPTDLDLTSDGKVAIAVLRDVGKVAILDIPADLIDPTGIEVLSTGKYLAGQASLTRNGKRAFIYTNATSQEVLLVADLVGRSMKAYPLKKGIRTVYGSPDDNNVVILHNKVPGTPSVADGLELYVDKSHGYSLLNLSSGLDKLMLTGADPGAVEFSSTGASAYLLLGDRTRNIRSVETIDLGSFLVGSVKLGSVPVSLGVIDAVNVVHVAQSHELGRITFVDMKTHSASTVTGFELNSHIID